MIPPPTSPIRRQETLNGGLINTYINLVDTNGNNKNFNVRCIYDLKHASNSGYLHHIQQAVLNKNISINLISERSVQGIINNLNISTPRSDRHELNWAYL